MILYNNTSNRLLPIKEKPFKLERDIQRLFEANLEEIMGLELVRSEFTIKNKRIDTLAFDRQSNAFIIIEYKKDKNYSVIDQGFTYLSLMLENKSDFILEYNERMAKTLVRSDVDWSQTRVVFVSTGFTTNQVQAVNFKDLAIELWEIKQYTNGTIVINEIKKSASAESIKPVIQSNKELKAVSDEIIVYNEDYHLNNAPEYSRELYTTFRNAILNLGTDISVEAKKKRISFDRNGKIFTDILLQKDGLKIWINLKRGQLKDPLSLTRDVSSIGHWGNGDYELTIKNTDNLEYVLSLIKQAIR